jgi:hypothetical protein
MELKMRVRVTVYYGEEGLPLSRESKEYQLLQQNEDAESFGEALDFITEQVLEPYQSNGHDLEDDEEEMSIGVDYLAAWFLPDWFDTRADAKDFLKELMVEVNSAMSDLE